MGAAALLRRNLLIYGLGGIIAPFPGIWIIDQLLVAAASGVRSRLMWEQLLPALRITLVMTVLTGLVYPRVVTGIAQVLFPEAGERQL